MIDVTGMAPTLSLIQHDFVPYSDSFPEYCGQASHDLSVKIGLCGWHASAHVGYKAPEPPQGIAFYARGCVQCGERSLRHSFDNPCTAARNDPPVAPWSFGYPNKLARELASERRRCGW